MNRNPSHFSNPETDALADQMDRLQRSSQLELITAQILSGTISGSLAGVPKPITFGEMEEMVDGSFKAALCIIDRVDKWIEEGE